MVWLILMCDSFFHSFIKLYKTYLGKENKNAQVTVVYKSKLFLPLSVVSVKRQECASQKILTAMLSVLE